MDFSDAPYVRIYTAPSSSDRLFGFWGRVLMDELVKHADRAGVIDLPEEYVSDLPTAVAAVIGCDDPDWVQKHLPKLMREPNAAVVLKEEKYLVLPRYCAAQYANMTAAASSRAHRLKVRAIDRAVALGLIHKDNDDEEDTIQNTGS